MLTQMLQFSPISHVKKVKQWRFIAFFGGGGGVCGGGRVGEGETEANGEFASPCLGKSWIFNILSPQSWMFHFFPGNISNFQHLSRDE